MWRHSLLLAAVLLSACGSSDSADKDAGQAVLSQTSATVVADPPPASGAQEVWECDFGEPEGAYRVTLTATSYQFSPYNPDRGALSGVVNILKEENRNGGIVTDLELVGSGAPPGRWGFVQDPGKRKALLTYAVESSGDAQECTPPGEKPQYVFN
jgi:hypothetical protein